MRIEWLATAERNLTAQLEWIADHNLWAAIDVGEVIHAAVGRLANYPAMGRPGRVGGTRKLAIVGTAYVVVYRIEPSSVVILRVLHGAQRWPPRDVCR